MISATTITQVHSVHISYVAWSEVSTLNIISGKYLYEKSPGFDISHTPTSNIGRNYARIFGITGFIINIKNQNYIFETVWTGSKFHFNLD